MAKVRLDFPAKELGVTKGGFSWQFGDRTALLDAMLDAREQCSVDDPIATVDALEGDARARLRELYALAFWLLDRLPIEPAIRDWARRDPAVYIRMERADNRRMAYMRKWFSEICFDPDEVEARCLLAFTAFVGQSFVAASHESRSRVEVMTRAMDILLA